MTLDEFRASLKGNGPPGGLTAPLEALWHAARGVWDRAHGICQQQEGEPSHDWVHAYLHRVEGDLGNAGYWYRRAGRRRGDGSLDAEWAEIAGTMLDRR
jgi:hypothetical protein